MALSQLESCLVRGLSGPQMFSHIEKLCAFGPRPLGSAGDENSIKYLEEELRGYGAEFEAVDFEIAVARETKAELKLISPQERSIECQAFYRSAPSPPEGVTTNNVIDVGNGTEEGYQGKNVAGAIVLATAMGMHPVPKSELAGRKGAAACVWISPRRHGLIVVSGLGRYGSVVPVVSISYEDGEFLRRLLSQGGITLAMRVDTDLEKSKGKHVIGIVRGKKWPEEICVLCAHRETVPGSVGANDNASGVAIVLQVFKALASYGPSRTIWALLSTAEEGGGIGVRAFVASNRAKMERVRALINLDMLGEGPKMAIVAEAKKIEGVVATGVGDFEILPSLKESAREHGTLVTSDALNKVLLEAAGDLGYDLVLARSARGLADTTPFVEAGVPATFMTTTGRSYHHTIKDLPDTINVNGLKVAADILVVGLVRLDQSVSLDNL